MVSPPFGNSKKERVVRLKFGGSDTYVKVGLSSFFTFRKSWKGIINNEGDFKSPHLPHIVGVQGAVQ